MTVLLFDVYLLVFAFSLFITSSVFLVFVHPTSLASLAKMDGARSKVKVDLNSLVNYLSCSRSHRMCWGDVLRSKIRFPWN